jgi:hypothetical protein
VGKEKPGLLTSLESASATEDQLLSTLDIEILHRIFIYFHGECLQNATMWQPCLGHLEDRDQQQERT